MYGAIYLGLHEPTAPPVLFYVLAVLAPVIFTGLTVVRYVRRRGGCMVCGKEICF
ncbi:hypothetical protein RA11412_1226 [Rothia aeria]|uniref:Uncharacterized protein n=1 Tax=Rothia aeria TaxID=172042 RepID=A0A2Z5QYH8_9MICC|nr:hypothetical protein RA11412_1226 [Rothia aeria]